MLGESERNAIDLGDYGPSDNCIDNLMERNGLKYMTVQAVEDKRLSAITATIVSEHIARIQATIDRYHIRDPRFIFNTDQSGSSLKRMCGRSLCKGYGMKNKKFQQACIHTKGQLERITVMPCVSASGKAYKPVIVFPGVQPHYRKVRGVLQGLHAALPDCYLRYREVPGADSAILYDWAQNFVEETKELRRNGQYLLLILDGYSAHIQFKTLNHFRRHRVVVIALPAHSSYHLQQLDVSVFNSYKSFLQAFLHNATRVKNVLNAFNLASLISHAYEKAMTNSNIRSGFLKCGIWDDDEMGTNGSLLQHLFDNCDDNAPRPTVDDLVNAFIKKGQSLLRDAEVEEEGTIKIGTTRGAHLTCDAVLKALEVRESKKLAIAKKKALSADLSMKDAREPHKALLHYAELFERRHMQRKRLRETRDGRGTRQKIRMSSK